MKTAYLVIIAFNNRTQFLRDLSATSYTKSVCSTDPRTRTSTSGLVCIFIAVCVLYVIYDTLTKVPCQQFMSHFIAGNSAVIIQLTEF